MTERLNPYSNVTYHKGWQKDKVLYPVLVVTNIDSKTREMIRGALVSIVTSKDAEKMVWQDKGHEQGWGLKLAETAADVSKRVRVITYRGMEVALLFERQVQMIEPAPSDPIPEGYLEIPSDASMKLDLMGKSAREANQYLKQRHEKITEDKRIQGHTVLALETQVKLLETNLLKANDTVESKDKELERLREQLAVIRAHVDGKRIRKWMDKHKIELQKKAEKEAKRLANIAAFNKEQKEKRTRMEGRKNRCKNPKCRYHKRGAKTYHTPNCQLQHYELRVALKKKKAREEKKRMRLATLAAQVAKGNVRGKARATAKAAGKKKGGKK